MKSLVMCILALAGAFAPVEATVIHTVGFEDPGGTYAPFHGPIGTSLLTAGQEWSQALAGSGIIDVVVGFDPRIRTAQGASTTSQVLGTAGPLRVVEPGAASEIRTGVDPNGAEPDARIMIGTAYLTNELFFGPGIVPNDKTDARSVFLHELGHIYAFSGFLNSTTGETNGVDISTFDQHVRFDGTNFFFTGAAATALYKGDVPLTFGNYVHLGNGPGRPGEDLVPDLMNGVSFDRGRQYEISALDLAIFNDVGVAIVPEPGTLVLVGSGILGLGLRLAARRLPRRD
jgi:hypothetical protein